MATAYDGLEALAIAEEFRPRVVLLDLNLPRLNGREVARRLRETNWGAGIFIAAMSRLDSIEDERASLAAGCNLHLAKPLSRIGPLVASMYAQLTDDVSTARALRDAMPTLPSRVVTAEECGGLTGEDVPFLLAIVHDKNPNDAAAIWNDWLVDRGREERASRSDWRAEAFRLLLSLGAPAFRSRRLWLTDDDCKATRASQGRLSRLAIDAIYRTAANLGVRIRHALPSLPVSGEARGRALAIDAKRAGRWWVVVERVHDWDLQDEADLVREIVTTRVPMVAIERYAAWLDAEAPAQPRLDWRRLIANPIVRSLAFQRLLALVHRRRDARLDAVWLTTTPEEATPYGRRGARDRYLERLARKVRQAGLFAKLELVAISKPASAESSGKVRRRLLVIRTAVGDEASAVLIGFVRLQRSVGAGSTT